MGSVHYRVRMVAVSVLW